MRTLLSLTTGLCLSATLLCFVGTGIPRPAAARAGELDPIERLLAGNARWVEGHPAHFNQDRDRRRETAQGQQPFAVVVGCADSRVPPEIVFDQGLGDLFVVRCAGNVLDDLALASIEYAVEHLGARTIVVLGHERCGAVQAALQGGELPGHLRFLARALAPHLENVRRKLPPASSEEAEGAHAPARIPAELLDQGVRDNVAAIVGELEGCEPILAELEHAGELRIVGARYDLDSGKVEILPGEAGGERSAPASSRR